MLKDCNEIKDHVACDTNWKNATNEKLKVVTILDK